MLSYERTRIGTQYHGHDLVECAVRGAASDGTEFESSWVELARQAHPFAHARCNASVLRAIREHDNALRD